MSSQRTNTAFSFLFTSVSMILLAFFVYLNSLAQPNPDAEKRALLSIRKHFIASASTSKQGQGNIVVPKVDVSFEKISLSKKFSQYETVFKENGSSIVDTDSRIIISTDNALLFIPSDDQLRASAIEVLGTLAKLIKEEQLRLTANLYAEDAPLVSERFVTRWELSTARATALYRFLLDNGVEAHRLRFKAYEGVKDGGKEALSELVLTEGYDE